MEVKGNPGNARAGGFFQDSAGTWIKGFAINIGFCTSIRAELWAVITGLEMTWYMGLKKLQNTSCCGHGIWDMD